MAYREVTMLEVKEVLRLWLAGAGKKPIVAQLGLDVKTVRRYVRAAEECGLTPGPQLLTDEQLAQMIAAVRSPVERPHGETWELCLRERDFIAGQGAPAAGETGRRYPLPTLHRFAVAELDFGRTATTLPVAETIGHSTACS